MSSVFEFDHAKRAANKAKHGIDFVEAQDWWSGGKLVTAPARALEDELRLAAIGELDGKHWVAFYTLRGEAIRLISVRRARPREVEYYESQ